MSKLHYAGAAIGMAAAIGALAPTPALSAMIATPAASATLVDAEGKSIGQVALTQEVDGLLVKTTLTGMKPGRYGFHIHAVGKCDKPDFTTAGPHWNPMSHKHGKDAPGGPHMGDLLNIEVAASGLGSSEEKISGARLKGGEHPLLDADGAAVMLHAGPDDYKTDPAGASGPRIACGVVNITE